MQFSAAQIAMLINGKTEGDPNATVSTFGKIEEAVAGQLAFLANPGPWISVTISGSMRSRPDLIIVWVWPPQISISAQGRVTRA